MTDSGDSGFDGHPVTLQKIYVRDASLEVPAAPRVFTGDWQPSINVDLDTRIESLEAQGHHVSVTATVTARQDDTTAYIIEVEQAGVFELSGIEDDAQREQVLGAYCPSVLFPYLRQTVGELAQRAGFPHFLLQPIDFNALYQRYQDVQNQPDEHTAARH